MRYLWIFAILFGFLLVSSPAFGYPASKFVADYGYELSEGQKIKVLVQVKGEPKSLEPAQRAKEIRYIQAAVLKFSIFAGATNVKSDTWNNEFTAIVTTSLAQVLEQRRDVIAVHVLEAQIQLPPKLQEMLDENDVAKLPIWIQKTINWHNQGKISEYELLNAINFLLNEKPLETVIDKIIKQHIPVDAESAEKARQIGAKGVVLASESFVMDRYNPTITITSSDIKGQDAIIFEGTGFRGLHIIDIIITNEFDFKVELKTKTGQNGVLNMPWILFFEPLDPGIYNVKFSDRVSSHDITIKVGDIEKEKEKTKLRLISIPSSRFNGGFTIVFSGNLFTDSGKIIRDAEILLVGDGPCPADGIIAKGQTDNRGKYRIMVETMIWDPSDNMIKIHAEYLGDEFYGPSSTQSEIIVVYPNKDTKRC